MAIFEIALPILLKNEGGYVDNPHDPGRATNMGITIDTFQTCAQTLLSVAPSVTNLKALTAAQAGIIYKANYWNKMYGDQLALQELANIVFDFYVNSSAHAAILLQQVMVQNGATIKVDGGIGPATMKALSGMDQKAIYNQYKAGRIAYYTQLGKVFPTFLKGWLNRVNAFPDL